MKPITRDIVVTLFVKLTLLFALWWVCFKDVHKPNITAVEWIMGDKSHSILPNQPLKR